MFDDDFADPASRSVGFEPLDIGVGHERNVGVLEGRVDGTHLRVGLRVNQAGKAVTGLAADAAAGVGIFLVEHDAERRVKRAQAQTREVVGQLLDARLMAHRRLRVGSAAFRLGGVLAGVAVHVVEPLGFGVVGLHVVVGDRPGRRYAAVVFNLAEVFFA